MNLPYIVKCDICSKDLIEYSGDLLVGDAITHESITESTRCLHKILSHPDKIIKS